MVHKHDENTNKKDDTPKVDKPKQLISHLDRIANSFEKFSHRVEESYVKRRFYKHPSFWAAVLALTGLFGVLFTWRDQIAQINARSTQRQIVIIRNYQSELNRSITFARVLIINQSLDCPITDHKKKIEFQKLRNLASAKIISSTANLRFSGGSEIQGYSSVIIQRIYSMSSDQLCKIDIEKNDDFLRKTQNQINSIIDKKVIDKESRTKHFWWDLED